MKAKKALGIIVFTGLILSPTYAGQSDKKIDCYQTEVSNSVNTESHSEKGQLHSSEKDKENLGLLIRLLESDPRGESDF